jgi:hypothetical protein
LGEKEVRMAGLCWEGAVSGRIM